MDSTSLLPRASASQRRGMIIGGAFVASLAISFGCGWHYKTSDANSRMAQYQKIVATQTVPTTTAPGAPSPKP